MRLRITKLKDQGKEDDLDGTTVEQRWDMMWPLAVTAWAFMGEEDASAEGLPRASFITSSNASNAVKSPQSARVKSAEVGF
jgi:hypothetical protein